MTNSPHRCGVLIIVVLLAVLLGACAPNLVDHDLGSDQSMFYTINQEHLNCLSRAADTSFEGTTWWLISMRNGEDLLPLLSGTFITAHFGDEWLDGSSGCNWYWVSYTTDGDSMTINRDLISTMVFCLSPPGINEQESAYQETLWTVASYEQTEDKLRLLNAEDEPILIFHQLTQTYYMPIAHF